MGASYIRSVDKNSYKDRYDIDENNIGRVQKSRSNFKDIDFITELNCEDYKKDENYENYSDISQNLYWKGEKINFDNIEKMKEINESLGNKYKEPHTDTSEESFPDELLNKISELIFNDLSGSQTELAGSQTNWFDADNYNFMIYVNTALILMGHTNFISYSNKLKNLNSEDLMIENEAQFVLNWINREDEDREGKNKTCCSKDKFISFITDFLKNKSKIKHWQKQSPKDKKFMLFLRSILKVVKAVDNNEYKIESTEEGNNFLFLLEKIKEKEKEEKIKG